MVCVGVRGIVLMALLALLIAGVQGGLYQLSGAGSVERLQFAAAVNVQDRYCSLTFDNNFLDGESSATVKQELSEHHLYEGQKLVAATPKGAGSTAVHSERTLLIGDNNHPVTPIQNLLNKDKDGCAVFYTYNSPCLDYCLDKDKDDNEHNREKIQNERNEKNRQKGKPVKKVDPAVLKCILNSLSVLTNHKGLKAFVFSQVYRKDIGNEKLADALKEVAEKVPLFRCSGGSCVQCLSGNQIVIQCLEN